MEGLAKKKPLLILFEDAHWADATSLEVLDLLLKSFATAGAVTDHLPSRIRERHESVSLDVATVALGRLDRVQAKTSSRRVTGGRELPAEVLAQIVAQTDGVPLFVEELTKHVLESGLLVEGPDRYRLGRVVAAACDPFRHCRICWMARPRLASPRLRTSRRSGRRLGANSPIPCCMSSSAATSRRCGPRSRNWRDLELVFRSGEPPAARYTFKHALVRDTAYESLLKSRRQILHQKIAETLREHFADIVEAEPELLAHHFDGGGPLAARTAI